MMHQIKAVFHRTQETLWQDAIGAGALMVMLIVALHVPGLI